MPDCDGFFARWQIDFDPVWEDTAVYTVWRELGREPNYAKSILLCWFDMTYGAYRGMTFDRKPASDAMKAFLSRHSYASFEEIFDSKTVRFTDARKEL